MSDQIIEVPGHGEVEFPDSMSDADIAEAISHITGKQPRSYVEDVGRFAKGELKGAGQAALGAIDPRTYLNLGKDLTTNWGRGIVSGVKDLGGRILSGDPEAFGNVLGGAAMGKVLPSAASAATKIPAGRILTAGAKGAKAGVENLPLVGKPIRAAGKAAAQSWQQSSPSMAETVKMAAPVMDDTVRMPAPTPAFEPQASPLPQMPVREIPAAVQPAPAVAPKMKLSAPEVAQMLRQQYGSEQAGRMLYGKGQPGGLPAGERQAAIKRLAPGESKLPAQAQVRIQAGVQEGTPSAAWRYVQAAPNAIARDFLIKLMRGK